MTKTTEAESANRRNCNHNKHVPRKQQSMAVFSLSEDRPKMAAPSRTCPITVAFGAMNAVSDRGLPRHPARCCRPRLDSEDGRFAVDDEVGAAGQRGADRGELPLPRYR